MGVGSERFNVAVITVLTPLHEGAPDLPCIDQSAKELAAYVRPGSTVILESTTYPGTTEVPLLPILEAGSGLVAGSDCHVGYRPERVDPGNGTWIFRNTRKWSRGSMTGPPP